MRHHSPAGDLLVRHYVLIIDIGNFERQHLVPMGHQRLIIIVEAPQIVEIERILLAILEILKIVGQAGVHDIAAAVQNSGIGEHQSDQSQ